MSKVTYKEWMGRKLPHQCNILDCEVEGLHEHIDMFDMSEVKSEGHKDAKDIQIHAIPWEALQEIGKVYHYGATDRGYGDYNFRGGYDWTLTFDAMMRHAWAFWNREDNDPESGFSHMAHAAWHAITLCFFSLTKRGNDDRPT